MTGLERYRQMLKRQPVDFVPRVPVLMQFAAEYLGSNYGAFASDYRVLVDANIHCAEDFGMDQVSTISDPYRETTGFGADVKFIEDGVPRCVRSPLENSKDLSLLRHPDPLSSPRMLDRVKAVESYKQKCGKSHSILGWVEGPAAEAADLRGVTNFLMDQMDDEPFAEDLMDRCVQTAIEFARAQIEAGADTIGVGDAIASQVSPDLYERLIQPREKKLVEAIHGAGGLVRLHVCGNITHLLPGISDLAVDIIDVDHMVDMTYVRKVLGHKIVLAGNINPADGVRFGTPSNIKEYIRKTYNEVGNPFFVSAGCEIPAGTPWENLKALCEPIPYQI